MIDWKSKWICFKENGVFPRTGFMININAIEDASYDELIYGTSIRITVAHKWWWPTRWLFGRCEEKRLDPTNILIHRFEDPKEQWGKSPIEKCIVAIKKFRKMKNDAAN